MQTAVELFENTLNWLQENYFNFRFFTERDVVWTLQTHLSAANCRVQAQLSSL